MMRLTRPACPAEHTAERKIALTQRFLADRSARVWKQDYFDTPLLSMSFNKCAYCETNVTKQAMYMEVDHFYCKKIYPDRVVDWNNLLPACKICNGNKSDYDVVQEPIVDPTSVDPRQHLTFENYRFHGADDTGKRTIGVIGLNQQRRGSARYKIGEAIYDSIGILARDLHRFERDPKTQNRTALIQGLDQILREAGPEAEYCSTAATILVNSSKFAEIIRRTEALNLWNAELASLYRVSEAIAYLLYPSCPTSAG